MTFPIMVNNISKEAYSICLQFRGVHEFQGSANNRLIVVAHHLTGCSIEHPSVDVDSTIPWCSSWVNLMVVLANIRANPGAAFDMLEDKGFRFSFIKELFKLVGKSYDSDARHFTGREIVPPTWSAASKSWDAWGEEVPFNEAKRGDLVRLTRDGGGHIAFLDDDTLGVLFSRLLGGNQADKVGTNNYSRSRVVTIRRSLV